MIKNWIATLAIGLMSLTSVNAVAKDLPDFTELAEKQGPAVVNISITQNVQAQNPMSPFGGMPEDEQMQEFLNVLVFLVFQVSQVQTVHRHKNINHNP